MLHISTDIEEEDVLVAVNPQLNSRHRHCYTPQWILNGNQHSANRGKGEEVKGKTNRIQTSPG